jgi:hypothetical protein
MAEGEWRPASTIHRRDWASVRILAIGDPAFIVAGVLPGMNASPRVPWRLVRDNRVIDAAAPLPRRIAGQRILIANLPPIVHRRTFERCELVGPPSVLLSGCKIDETRWLGMFDTSLVEVDDAVNLPAGTVTFLECCFIGCELQSFVAVGLREQLDGLRAIFPEGR